MPFAGKVWISRPSSLLKLAHGIIYPMNTYEAVSVTQIPRDTERKDSPCFRVFTGKETVTTQESE